MKKIARPIQLLMLLSLLLSFALPAAAESESSASAENPAVGEILIEAIPGDAALTISFPKVDTLGNAADSFEISVFTGEPDPAATPVVIAAESVKGDTVEYTANKLVNNTPYSVSVVGKTKDGSIVSNGNGFGVPFRMPGKMPGLVVTAGDAQITVTFSKLPASDKAATYQIHWWTEVDKKTKEPKFQKPIIIKASDVKNKTYTYTFKKMKNGTTYHFNVFAEDTSGQILYLSQDVTAAPAKAKPVKANPGKGKKK
ncbi:fibronectin type III domain-containing protein [Cohnella candidum]|uniref:Fibronectin type-III domain-containing protein n=1 Tax=Cohnella candidum TaxID=2674991 RepID=A0A3G3JYZ9_9BACL|nr:fibronectin type III domain-containing protein [Cohnella candidum]AYQ72729.1 hypothetical protein EAV92_09235 [Cohnella candidum]